MKNKKTKTLPCWKKTQEGSTPSFLYNLQFVKFSAEKHQNVNSTESFSILHQTLPSVPLNYSAVQNIPSISFYVSKCFFSMDNTNTDCLPVIAHVLIFNTTVGFLRSFLNFLMLQLCLFPQVNHNFTPLIETLKLVFVVCTHWVLNCNFPLRLHLPSLSENSPGKWPKRRSVLGLYSIWIKS